MDTQNLYQELVQRYRDKVMLDSVAGLIGWDERTMMPEKGSAHRAEQMAVLAKIGHEKLTSPRIGELLGQLEGTELTKNPDADEAVNLREIRRLYDRAVKMPARLVEELARTVTRAQNVWQEARAKNDFPSFAPWLEKIVALKREEAQAVGYKESPYDALLEEYEPGATAREITAVFRDLQNDLVPLVQQVLARPQPDGAFLTRDFPVERQKILCESLATAVGFDPRAGRLDTTVHPFCSGIGPGDCRITTRYQPHHFSQGFFGVLHEAGHGMYELGLPAEHFGTPRGSAVSLGIHESQSRLWENQIGRSLPFWKHFFPRTQQMFPAALDDVRLEEFHRAINTVANSYIRVDADELTYNLHIILRFELEQALIAGDLPTGEVPGAWNEKFTKMFSLTPPDDARGCLQDIHWSMGGLGYFPTYTLGNLYAAQFMEKMRQDLPGLDEELERGNFRPVNHWLNEKIYQPGGRYRAGRLCEVVTGRPLSHRPFVLYLREKFDVV